MQRLVPRNMHRSHRLSKSSRRWVCGTCNMNAEDLLGNIIILLKGLPKTSANLKIRSPKTGKQRRVVRKRRLSNQSSNSTGIRNAFQLPSRKVPNLNDKSVSNLKSLFCHAAFLRQAETGVSQLLGYNDLTKKRQRHRQPSHSAVLSDISTNLY